jgi:hypothetical protein
MLMTEESASGMYIFHPLYTIVHLANPQTENKALDGFGRRRLMLTAVTSAVLRQFKSVRAGIIRFAVCLSKECL